MGPPKRRGLLPGNPMGWRSDVVGYLVLGIFLTLDRCRWHMQPGDAVSQSDPSPRRPGLFRNNRNQAIHIPVEFEPPGNKALFRRYGSRFVIEMRILRP